MDKSLVLTKAKAAVMSHDFTTAARLYKDLLKDDPSNVDYLKQLGSIYVQSQQDEKAIPYYEQIITFYPHYVDAMNSLGAIFRRLHRYQDSIDILQRALDEDRQLATVNYNLGFTYKEMGNYVDAIEAFEMVIEANPDDVLAYNHLGSIYYAQKKYDKSIAAYRRGLQIDRNHPILNYNLARAYQADGNESDAIKCYQSTLKTRPGWKDCISDYSGLLLNCQKTKEASDLVQQAIKLHPNDADLLSILGTVYLNEYDYNSAEDTFRKADSIKGNDVKILSGLAEALEKGDKPENALDAVLSALEIDPENKDIRKQYVNTLLSAEDYEKAYSNVKELYDNGGDRDVQVLDLYGQYYITQNDETKAKTYFSKIERINGKYKDYQVNAAKRFVQIGKYENAENYAKEYVKNKPHSADGYNMLGKISVEKGDLSGAKYYYGKSQTLKKPNILAAINIENINERLINGELEQDSFIAPPEIEETYEVVEDQIMETADESEEEEFDYSSMGQSTPLQEGLVEDEENFWGDEEKSEEENPESEEEAPAEETEEENVPGLNDLLDAEEEPFDFGAPVKASEESEEEEIGQEEPEEVVEEEPVSEEIPEPAFEPVYTPESEAEPVVEEKVIPEPEPKEEPRQYYAPDPYMDQMTRMMQDQVLRSAQQAMNAAMEAQKMAENLADEQFLLRKETENALEEALNKVKELTEKNAVEEKAPVEEEVFEEETAEEIVEEEVVEEEQPSEEIPEDDIVFCAVDEIADEIEVSDQVEINKEPASVENDIIVTKELVFPTTNSEEETTLFATVDDLLSDEDVLAAENTAVENNTPEESVDVVLEDFAFANVDELISEEISEIEDTSAAEEETSLAEDTAFASVDELVTEEAVETDTEDFATVDELVTSEEDAVASEEEDSAAEDTTFASVEELVTEDAVETDTEDFATVDELVNSEEDTVASKDDDTVVEESDFTTVDELITEDAVESEEEPVEMEASIFASVEELVTDEAGEVEEEPVIEEAPAIEEEPVIDANPIMEEEPLATVDEIVPDYFAEEDNLDEVKETLERIQRNLNDDEKALNNADKIEMFKALRVLSSYLPEVDKTSFQSCRNRMVIDYLISKMSGKPGLMEITQSLINSGVLGDEYADRVTDTSSEEISNELVKRVLESMKSLAVELEDKDLAQALCASADNILQRLEELDSESIL